MYRVPRSAAGGEKLPVHASYNSNDSNGGVRPPRVLHVLGSLGRGGVETWLMNIARRSTREAFPMDVVLLGPDDRGRDHEQEFQDLGGRIWQCSRAGRRLSEFSRHFRKILCEGQFDIIHSHVHLFSGHLLRLAAKEGVPGRLVHSHNDTRDLQATASPLRHGYQHLMKLLIRRYAVKGLACSDFAARALYGDRWCEDGRWQVLPYGIDLTPFLRPEREAVRRELGLRDDQYAIIHVGRCVEQKNHKLLLAVADELRRMDPNVCFLLVGSGPLMDSIKAEVVARGLERWVRILGSRGDVPRLLSGADLFVLPSRWEGLGIVAIEALSAGLPAVISDKVPPEVEAMSRIVHRVPLDAGARKWAETIAGTRRQPRLAPAEASSRVHAAGFSVEASLENLIGVYRELSTRSTASAA